MAQATASPRPVRFPPRWARSTHPVYQRELDRWARSRGLRSLRVGSAPLAFLVFAAMGGLCGLTTLDPSATPAERLLMWALILLWSLLVGQVFVSFATGLIATALTATVISGEIESETFGLLRVTDVPTGEIVLAKYAATLRQLVAPLAVVVVARLLLIAGGLATLDLAVRLQGIDGGLLGLLANLPPELVSPLSVVLFGLSVAAWLAFFAFKPLLTILMFASVGLFASSITRTRINGVIAAVVLRVVLFVARFIADQALTIGGQLAIGTSLSLGNLGNTLGTLVVTQPALLVGLGGLLALGGLLVAIGWRGGVTLLLIRATVRRAHRLPYE
jgi:hypothetical protein